MKLEGKAPEELTIYATQRQKSAGLKMGKMFGEGIRQKNGRFLTPSVDTGIR